MFGNFNTGTVVLIVLAGVIYLYLRHLDKKQKSGTAATLCKKYQTLTAETLSALSDQDLVNAVVANLFAKTDNGKTDLYIKLASLSHGRTVVYSVWLLCNEIQTTDFEKLSASSRRFAEIAADAFLLLGTEKCAAALQTAVQTFTDGSITAMASQNLRRAVEQEQPLTRCATYIRENIEEFCDQEL